MMKSRRVTPKSGVTLRYPLELTKRGGDPEVRKCLSRQLPVLLEQYQERKDGRNFIWGSEAQVAGYLKIVEAAPVLARRIDMHTSGGMGGSMGYNFFDYEADYALTRIGPPAVRLVIDVLNHGNPLQREIAAHVLRYIGTHDAWQALEDRLPKESDPKVRARIREALKSHR
jgi:HEAT repeat protein